MVREDSSELYILTPTILQVISQVIIFFSLHGLHNFSDASH